MDAAKIAKALEIFDLVVDLPTDRREPLLVERCGDDADLRAHVERLLSDDAKGLDEFMHEPVFGPPSAGELEVKAPLPERIGRYEILRLIGEGGMGIVYEAKQEHPHRTVALKVIRSGLATRSVLRRFQHEAEMLGQLHHPGIAHIYEAAMAEVTTAGGGKMRQPFLAMEFIHGDVLTDYAKQNDLNIPARLELVAKICDAVQHAHQKGVIHRDLKPGNILVDETGQPKILDFGVARATDADIQTVTMQTDIGQLVGTVPYMSPEQVTGDSRKLDTRSDVYALGVILYELLSGKLPCDVRTTSIPEAVRRIRDEEPERLASIDRSLRGEIETIVSKTLEKEKERRYQSAAELADDIRRYLRGEPIEAKRDSTLYVLGKTLVRYRGLVGAGTCFVILLAAFGAVSFIQAERNRRLAADESKARLAAVESKERANQQAETLRRSLYFSRIGHAQAALGNTDVGRMKRLLEECPEGLRNWEWHYLSHLSDRSIATVNCDVGEFTGAVLSRDGRRIVTLRTDGYVGVYDALTRTLLRAHWTGRRHCTAVGPAGQRALADQEGTLIVRDLLTWDRLSPALRDPDGKFPAPGAHFRATAYGPDGSIIAAGDTAGTVRLWNAATGEVIHTFRCGDKDIICIGFTPDNAMIAVGDAGDTITVWEVETGRQVHVLVGHRKDIAALAVSPDVRLLASGSNDADIRLWDMATGEQVAILKGHQFNVASVHFSPDSALLVSGSSDGLVKLWDVATHEQIASLRGHTDKVRLVSFTPEGRELLSVGRDGMLKWWSPFTRPDTPTISTGQRQVTSITFSADDRQMLSTGGDGTVKVWDVAELSCSLTLQGHSRLVCGAAFSPDGLYIASGSLDHTVRLWDALSGAEIRTFSGHTASVHSVAFAPCGTRIVSADATGDVKVWDRFTGDELLTFHAHDGVAYAAVFSPDGKRIASGGKDKVVKVWDAASGAELLAMTPHKRLVYSVCFSPDGSCIASVDGGGYIRTWDAHDGRLVLHWAGHPGAVLGVAYSPDGTRLVTAGADNAVRVWEAATGDEVLTLTGHNRLVSEAVFSQDGTRIASSSDDGTIRLWESAPGR